MLAQTLTMKDVTFETNSSKLTLNGQRILDQVVAFLNSDDKVNLSIEGHTDSRGSDAQISSFHRSEHLLPAAIW